MTSSNPPESASEAKKSLRAAAVARREYSEVDSASICSSLELFLVRETGGSGRFVVVYDALAGEVDLGQLWDPSVRQLAPQSSTETVCYAITRTPETDMNLTVHSVASDLERHRWGYRQPVPGSAEIPDEEIAAVLVPGLAFDLNGGRLGWGAGYYDRFLSRLNPGTLMIGVSDGCIVDVVPTDDHDVPMTHIASPDGVISV